LGPDGLARKNSEAEPRVQTVEKTDAAPGASDVAQLQGRLQELQKQKSDAEGRLKALQARFDVYENIQKDLNLATSRIAELESAAAFKDKDLSAARQKIAELEKALAQEKSSKDRQNVDVSSKDAAAAELQKELKNARERVAQLEAAVSEGDRKRIQIDQKFGELEKALAGERGAKDQMSAELSSRQAAAADLQKRLEAARSAQLKLEADLQNAQRENARLQSQLQEAKAQKPLPPPAPVPARAPAAGPPQPAASDTAGAGPDPGGVIDFVIKKKSQ
jgi:chromosome segregation ATPase